MAGRSRSVLNKIGNLRADFVRNYNEIVKQDVADNSIDKTGSLQKIQAMQEKLEAEIATLLQDHITFLAKPDPYQREQTVEQANLSQYKLDNFKSLLKDVQRIRQISKNNREFRNKSINNFFEKLDKLNSELKVSFRQGCVTRFR